MAQQEVPLRDLMRRPQLRRDVTQAVDQFSQRRHGFRVATREVRHRKHRPESGPLVVSHRHPQQQPVHSRRPRVLEHGLGDAVAGAVGGVEAPADPGTIDQIGESLEGIVVESESGTHRGQRREVHDLGGREPTPRHGKEPVKGHQDVIGLLRGAVRHPHPQLSGGCGGVGIVGTEGRGDQRRVAGHVRCHDQDVPRFQRRIGLQEPQDGFTQDLDLARPPVAVMDLNGPIAPLRHRCSRKIVGDAGLKRGQHRGPGCSGLRDRCGAVAVAGPHHALEHHGQFTGVAPQ